ncbi:MAG: hypothetical protein AAB368_06605, partial [bacterium]
MGAALACALVLAGPAALPRRAQAISCIKNVQVAMTTAPAAVGIGENVTYRIVITNPAGPKGDQIFVTDTLAPALTNV